MSIFRFKQFSVQQEKVAMKVGTDSILLGAWVSLNQTATILDIGTGTGILALMLAQRSDATLIDAVEIDNFSFEESVTNFENSPWADRTFCYHTSIQNFTKEIDEKYDLIISNPPYFEPKNSNSKKPRDIARQTCLLGHTALLKNTKALLKPKGICAFIIPFEIEETFLKKAKNIALFPQRIMRTKDTNKSDYKRSLIELHSKKTNLIIDDLVLKTDDNSYSDKFKILTKDFYLEF